MIIKRPRFDNEKFNHNDGSDGRKTLIVASKLRLLVAASKLPEARVDKGPSQDFVIHLIVGKGGTSSLYPSKSDMKQTYYSPIFLSILD